MNVNMICLWFNQKIKIQFGLLNCIIHCMVVSYVIELNFCHVSRIIQFWWTAFSAPSIQLHIRCQQAWLQNVFSVFCILYWEHCVCTKVQYEQNLSILSLQVNKSGIMHSKWFKIPNIKWNEAYRMFKDSFSHSHHSVYFAVPLHLSLFFFLST